MKGNNDNEFDRKQRNGRFHNDKNGKTRNAQPVERLPLKERLKNIKTTRWIRFGVVSVIFFLWVIWMGNPWLALIWLLLIDIYITGFVPWTWWKNTTGTQRVVWGWVDAILYALILVYFIFAFIGQNYMIPSSSLEKSLLVGDYLWVNKALYGPRVPQTPLHFPLEQHTLPIINTKSYIENPQLPYHRLPGIRDIKRGDIVVFNYPQGDTVAVKIPNPDYYQIYYDLQQQGIDFPRAYMEANPQIFGDIVYRPVDRRENYVKRAIGLPGERLLIRNDTVFINGEPIKEPTHVQFNYIIPVNVPIPNVRWEEIGVSHDDYAGSMSADERTGIFYYDIPLTKEMKAKVEKWPEVSGPLLTEYQTGRFGPYLSQGIFPLGNNYGWSRPNMGEFWIPQRGATLRLTLDNLPVYERAIRVYEGNDLEVKDGKIYINGSPTDYYTFKMDYYWMMGDNRDKSADSRYWGFVPEDHIVGSPMFVFASFDKDKGIFDGKIRWDRIFRSANPDQGSW